MWISLFLSHHWGLSVCFPFEQINNIIRSCFCYLDAHVDLIGYIHIHTPTPSHWLNYSIKVTFELVFGQFQFRLLSLANAIEITFGCHILIASRLIRDTKISISVSIQYTCTSTSILIWNDGTFTHINKWVSLGWPY